MHKSFNSENHNSKKRKVHQNVFKDEKHSRKYRNMEYIDGSKIIKHMNSNTSKIQGKPNIKKLNINSLFANF